MNRRMGALAIALFLTGCSGQSGSSEGDRTPSAAEVEAGTTRDSADPRLNALQRTKRNVDRIEAERKDRADAADGTEP